jgi:xanthine dehydrogenase YagS FAD-binding subunit
VKELTYLRPATVEEAVRTAAEEPRSRYLAGGTNLVDHLKLGIATPEVLVDVRRLPLAEIVEVDGGLSIGATVSNTELAAHPLVRSRYAVVARAVLAGASGQIRNQATTGGNLLQRTRCVYFQDVTTPCNKREPGSGCSAIGGYGRYNAILGASDSCVATHPSDLAVALAVLDATVVVASADGERRVPFGQLHRLPADRPELDSTLHQGELVVAVELPKPPPAARSTYRKVRDRASYAFALVSVAAVLRLDDRRVEEVRIAWGGVAHKPWRARRAEEALTGQELTEEAVIAAVDAELAEAHIDDQSRYKIAMLRSTTGFTLLDLAEQGR